MRRIALGVLGGGAVAAACVGAAAAGADPAWTPGYDVDGAQLLAGPTVFPAPYPAVWEVPATFTHGTGANATTLAGTDYLMRSPGGVNDVFVTGSGAVYDQNQLGWGFTNLYYDGGAGHSVVDVMKTSFGNVDLSSMASWFAPVDFANVAAPAATMGEHFAVISRIQEALGLVNSNIGELWNGGPTDQSVVTALQTPDSSLVWSVPATFTNSIGTDVTTLTGTEYITTPIDVEFVADSGAVFDQHMWYQGSFMSVDNLYYAPVHGPAEDFLLTSFGTLDLSAIASWFAPADVSDLVAPSPLTDLADAGLYSALDLGLPT